MYSLLELDRAVWFIRRYCFYMGGKIPNNDGTVIDRRSAHLARLNALTVAKDRPSYRMLQRVEAEALIKQAADYFRLGEADLTRKRGQHRQERALVMELLHRYSGLKQRIIGERFGGLDEGVSEPRSESDPGKNRDYTEDPKVVSGYREAKYLSQDLTLA
jgi:hypothetical protein